MTIQTSSIQSDYFKTFRIPNYFNKEKYYWIYNLDGKIIRKGFGESGLNNLSQGYYIVKDENTNKIGTILLIE